MQEPGGPRSLPDFPFTSTATPTHHHYQFWLQAALRKSLYFQAVGGREASGWGRYLWGKMPLHVKKRKMSFRQKQLIKQEYKLDNRFYFLFTVGAHEI